MIRFTSFSLSHRACLPIVRPISRIYVVRFLQTKPLDLSIQEVRDCLINVLITNSKIHAQQKGLTQCNAETQSIMANLSATLEQTQWGLAFFFLRFPFHVTAQESQCQSSSSGRTTQSHLGISIIKLVADFNFGSFI